MLQWDKPNERYFEQGLDRGALYIGNAPPIPWNGLTGLDESADGGGSTLLYRDGVIYFAGVQPSDFKASITAIWFPDEFGVCIGAPLVTDGLIVSGQRPKPFSLSYRTLIGQGGRADPFGYQIHLVYNATASIGGRQHRSLSPDGKINEFSFDLVATPVKLPGYRPTAHYILDTRFMSQTTKDQLEGILYGTPGVPGRMPTPSELYDLLEFGDAITFQKWTHPTLGECWTATGAVKNVRYNPDRPGTFLISNVNGVDHGDGTYTLSDTP
jgi:hypothetical protein